MPSTPAKVQLPDWQEHFDFLLPRKEWLRVDEVAKALGCDERTVLRHFESGNLHGHDINAHTGQRAQIRYRRDSTILFLARRANYAPADLRARMIEVLSNQPAKDLILIQSAISELLRRKS